MAGDRIIPRDLREKVERELRDGERAQWIDMPIPHYFTPKSIASFLFAIPWTAFAIFWVCGASGFKLPDFKEGFDLFPLFGLPFILIGIGMLSTPIWTHRKALKTIYVVTDRRAITFMGGRSITIRSYPPEQLGNIYRKERRDGTGDIVFDRRSWRDSDGDRHSEELGFLRINNPKEVEELLIKLAERATAHE
jgi:hypothetical protein